MSERYYVNQFLNLIPWWPLGRMLILRNVGITSTPVWIKLKTCILVIAYSLLSTQHMGLYLRDDWGNEIRSSISLLPTSWQTYAKEWCLVDHSKHIDA